MHPHQEDNVVLFPKWKKTLEKESLSALKDKKYDEALTKLDELISYHIDNHEIMTGKLICLIELGKLTEAQDLCEELLKLEDENYYHYVHIYLTILFQTNQYDLLMEQVESEINKHDIPSEQKEQFLQLYEISEKMNLDIKDERESLWLQRLLQAVEDHDYVAQWRQIEELKRNKAHPSGQVINLLMNENVHPVVKTVILLWLKNISWLETVDVFKFGITLSLFPTELDEIENSEVVYGTLIYLSDIEQDNPSLYQLIQELLYHYAYVLYPINPSREDYVYIAKALEIIGRRSLGILLESPNNEMNQKLEDYLENIEMCESLYVSIIEG